MNNAEFQLYGIGDPRLAIHATRAMPAWLWSIDGTRILWSNPVGSALFGAANGKALAEKTLGPADPHRRQIAQLASRLPPNGAVRLERLRGFGAQPGMLATCGCSRLDFACGSRGVLVTAASTVRSAMPMAERLRRLVEGLDGPAAAFTCDGMLAGANGAARPLFGFRNLSEAGLDEARHEALRHGRAETATGMGHLVLQRAGDGADTALVALIAPQATAAKEAPTDTRDAQSEEAAGATLCRDEARSGPIPLQPPAAENPVAEDLPARQHELAEYRATDLPEGTGDGSPASAELPIPIASETSQQTELETTVETPKDDFEEAPSERPSEKPMNVLPFRPIGEPKGPVLTPVENSAFNELARQLSARLDDEVAASPMPGQSDAADPMVGQAALPDVNDPPARQRPEWLAQHEPPARGEAKRDKALLDLVPVGVLIYRLDRLVYANPAFLEQIGYPNLHALEDAGGLDALYVEPGVSNASSTSDTGTPVTISTSKPSEEHAAPSVTDARLYTISWDGDPALALIFSGPRNEGAAIAAAMPPEPEPAAGGHVNAEELGAILDTTAEGIVTFDAEGNINSCNRSAETLFGYDGAELMQRNLVDLFAPESQRLALDYLESTRSSGTASLLDQGREALGRVHQDGIIPLSLTMGRTRPNGPNFFAVFRDLSQNRKSESELDEARRLTDRATSAKADLLARVSHEVRTPLNAIIGFAEVMIGERFGELGNERYAEYIRDIRASGERVIAIIDDLLDLSHIETGKLDLAFTNQNLNELVENCVTVMQPQANQERIVIRTSLARTLPPVIADSRALRQITLNLIGSSIHLANTGGQVIISTALSDLGEVVLRVRDTGHGLNDNEVAAALEPFRTTAPSDRTSDGSAVSLSLTKALVEANRARFQIKSGTHSGTLIEVVFCHAAAQA